MSRRTGSDGQSSEILADDLFIIGNQQSIEISSVDNVRRRNSSPLPTLTSSVDEPSSSEDDSFGSEYELHSMDPVVLSNSDDQEKWGMASRTPGKVNVERGSIITPNVCKKLDRQDKEEVHSFWNFASFFPVSTSSGTSSIFCGSQSWCVREPYQVSPIATRKMVDASTITSTANSKAALHDIACSNWPYWNIGEDESSPSPDALDYADRYSTVSEPLSNRSNAAFVRRKERIESLRFNLAPFGYDVTVHGPPMAKAEPILSSKKIRSFTAVSGKVSSKASEPRTCTTVPSCTGSSHPVWDSAIMEEDGLCYDSDPGFLMPNRQDARLYTTSPSPKKSYLHLSSSSFDEDMSVSRL